MSNTKLIIDYDNRKIGGSSYGIKANVSVLSIPESIQPCLVVRKGSEGIKEQLVRVATFEEIYTTPLPTLPSEVNVFSSVTYGVIPNATTIMFTAPNWWVQYFGVSYTWVVVTVDSYGTLSSVLPAFANNLTFEIGGITYTDGLVNRAYSGSDLYYLTTEHCSEWETYEEATNMYTILSSGAQTLVNTYNSDNYSIQTQKVYV